MTVRMNATSANTHNQAAHTERLQPHKQPQFNQITTWIKMQGIHNSIPSHFTTYIQADYIRSPDIHSGVEWFGEFGYIGFGKHPCF